MLNFTKFSLKPRPYQQQCPSNIVVCYKFNDSFSNVECCFDVFNLFSLCRKAEISFDIVAETGNIVAKNGIIVERTKFYDTRSALLLFVATKSNVASTKTNVASTMLSVASTLLLVWTGLKCYLWPWLGSPLTSVQ